MGMFDNLLKQLDTGLEVVESGALEARLDALADAIERTSKEADAKLTEVAEQPAEVLKTVTKRSKKAEAKSTRRKQSAGIHMDIIRRKH